MKFKSMHTVGCLLVVVLAMGCSCVTKSGERDVGQELIHESDTDLADLLFYIRNGDALEVERYLQVNPKDVNRVLGDQTPLSCAVGNIGVGTEDEMVEVIKVLLQHDADMYQEFPTGGYPFEEIASRRCLLGLQVFLENDYDILFQEDDGDGSALNGMSGSEVTEFLLGNGADPNALNGMDRFVFLYTAVRTAVQKSHAYQTAAGRVSDRELLSLRNDRDDAYRCIYLLLDAGAERQAVSINGETAYELAVRESGAFPEDLIDALNPESD